MLLAVLFASCAKTGTVSSPAPGNSTISPEEQGDHTEDAAGPETDDPDALSFWAAATGNEAEVMRQIVDEYNHASQEAKVSLTLFEDETVLYNELQAAIAMKEAPDLAVLDRDLSREFYEKGQTLPPDAFLPDDAAFSEDVFLPPYLEQGKTEEGRVFAVPFYGTTYVLYYNKEAFASVKLKPEEIRTWQDVADAASLVQRRLVCEEGWELTWGYENLLDAAISNGGRIYSEDGRTVTINTEEWIQVWEQFRIWLHEDRFLRVHAGGLDDEWLRYTEADLLEMTTGGFAGSSADLPGLNPAVIGILPQPAWDEEHPATPGTRVSMLNVFSFSDTAHREGAGRFICYLTDVPAQAKWASGTGYAAANRYIINDKAYREYLKEFPDAYIPMGQAMRSVAYPADPTGEEIKQILVRAADRLLIENIPAGQVLDDAQREAQRALDKVLPPLPEEEENEMAEEGEEDVP